MRPKPVLTSAALPCSSAGGRVGTTVRETHFKVAMQEAYQTRLRQAETLQRASVGPSSWHPRWQCRTSGTPFALTGMPALGFRGQLSGATCRKRGPSCRIVHTGLRHETDAGPLIMLGIAAHPLPRLHLFHPPRASVEAVVTVMSDDRHTVDLNTRPRVSIIVPSWSGEVGRLVESIRAQTFRSYELEVVKGVSPAARARNLGVARTQGDILLFIDDDAYFGHKYVLQRLVSLLERNPRVGVAGTSKLAPKNATRLQKAIARQVPRMVFPVSSEDLESNPPLDGYGFTAVSTTCCAVPRAVFERVGGFNEELATGEDTDFFYRVRRSGYGIYIAGNTWVYHDPPASVTSLARKSFWYGVGHALEARTSPERRMNMLALDRWYGLLAVPAAILALPFALFVHVYFDPTRRVEVGFRPLKTLSTYAVLSGYIYGWFHGKPRKAASTYMGRKRNASA